MMIQGANGFARNVNARTKQPNPNQAFAELRVRGTQGLEDSKSCRGWWGKRR
jgi:hypothetical protein